MNTGAVIREKRKELGLTQEQVADYLGVSTPAVNKWEKGACYPDITLLPALARLLRTDVNALLCFGEGPSDQEIALYCNEVAGAVRADGFARGFDLGMEKVRQYPSCGALLHTMAVILDGALMMSALEDKSPYEGQITALYERAAESGDEKASLQAAFMLASKSIAREDYPRAQEMIGRLPEPTALDKRRLQSLLLLQQGKPDEAAALLEGMLRDSVTAVQSTLWSLISAELKAGDMESAQALSELSKGFVSLFGLWDYSAYVAPLQLATVRADVGECVGILRGMFAAILTPWDPGASPLYRHVSLAKNTREKAGNTGAQFLPPLLTELEQQAEYDFLRKDPEFQQLLQEYRAKCE